MSQELAQAVTSLAAGRGPELRSAPLWAPDECAPVLNGRDTSMCYSVRTLRWERGAGRISAAHIRSRLVAEVSWLPSP
jgi:hypothetical protein